MFTLLSIVFMFLLTAGEAKNPIADGPRGSGTGFKKCGGGFFGGSKRCFEVSVTKLVVQMGNDGTNDDVTVKICSDASNTCCSTPPLKKTFSDDWSKGDLETWGPRYLGDCAGKMFTVERGLNVSLAKLGDDRLEVTSFVVEAESVDSTNKQPEKFECGPWSIVGGGGGGEYKLCGTSQYTYESVKKIIVTMGNEGTDDDVRVDICSDVDDVCCRTKLSYLISDDWSRNDVEVWRESDLGLCAGVRYKVVSGLLFTLVKDGEDDLIVNKVRVEAEDLRGSVVEYDCKGFTLQNTGKNCMGGGSCQQGKLCSKQKQNSGNIGLTTRTPDVSSSTDQTRPGGGLLAQAGFILGNKKTTTTTTQATTTRTTRAPFFG